MRPPPPPRPRPVAAKDVRVSQRIHSAMKCRTHTFFAPAAGAGRQVGPPTTSSLPHAVSLSVGRTDGRRRAVGRKIQK